MPGERLPQSKAALAPTGRGAALLALLAALAIALAGVGLLGSLWLTSFTVREWRDAPAGSQLNILFDEPAHPPWSW